MATKNQFDVFRSLYDEESSRYAALMDRGKTYLSVMTLLSGLLVLKADDIATLARESLISKALLGGGVILFVGALIALLLAIRQRGYEVFADPQEIVDNMPDGVEQPDEEFFDERIGELTVATNVNGDQNDRLSKSLAAASYLLIVGSGLVVLSLLLRVGG